MLTLIAALIGLVLALAVLLYLYHGDLQHERMLARIFQEIAHDERERGDAWMERALYPDAGKTLWDAIDSFLEQERER